MEELFSMYNCYMLPIITMDTSLFDILLAYTEYMIKNF